MCSPAVVGAEQPVLRFDACAQKVDEGLVPRYRWRLRYRDRGADRTTPPGHRILTWGGWLRLEACLGHQGEILSRGSMLHVLQPAARVG